MSPICYQVSPIQLGDEDCLYLNINTPKVGGIVGFYLFTTLLSNIKNVSFNFFIFIFYFIKAIPAKLMPVIMYIHYGGFVKGFSGFPNSAKYFMDEDVVIVTLNYRLGILGILVHLLYMSRYNAQRRSNSPPLYLST